MRHEFATTLLLLAQVISWNASPLYLCLDGDGSLCIDQGPDSCGCERSNDCHEHSGSIRDACPNHQVARLDRSSDSQFAAVCLERPHCDCTHIQLTVPWTAVIVAPQKAWQAAVSSQTVFANNQSGIEGTLPLVLSRTLRSRSIDRISASAFPSLVVLRC